MAAFENTPGCLGPFASIQPIARRVGVTVAVVLSVIVLLPVLPISAHKIEWIAGPIPRVGQSHK